MPALRFGTMGPAVLLGRIVFVVILTSFLLWTPPLQAACVLGMGNCNGGISGSYLMQGDSNVTLKIDSTNISASVGPMTFSATYTVKNIEKNQILIEVSAPGTPKGEALLIVDGDTLHIKNNFVFNGDWKPK